MSYRGRFAPSPTGPLHLGSLVAAVGSYIRAKSQDGTWLIRIEDIDPPREEAGASDSILEALNAHAMVSDEPVLFQHQRYDAYQEVLHQLEEQNHLYWCDCTRKSIRAASDDPYGPIIYPGICKDKDLSATEGRALRIKTDDQVTHFDDQFIGRFEQNLFQETGDFVLLRADGLFSYQLAVVVDDAFQEITEVVRGQDLVDNTPRQVHLQKLLGYATPAYIHLPLVFNDDGQKLSKQNMAPALDNSKAVDNICNALEILGYPAEIRNSSFPAPEIFNKAIEFERNSPLLIRKID